MATQVPISEVKGDRRENRTAAHSHIKGLGLSNGLANTSGGGFIGQGPAREVGTVFLRKPTHASRTQALMLTR